MILSGHGNAGDTISTLAISGGFSVQDGVTVRSFVAFGRQEKLTTEISRPIVIENRLVSQASVRFLPPDSGVFRLASLDPISLAPYSKTQLPLTLTTKWDGIASHIEAIRYVVSVEGREWQNSIDFSVHPLLWFRAEPNVIMFKKNSSPIRRTVDIVDANGTPVTGIKIAKCDAKLVSACAETGGKLVLHIDPTAWIDVSRCDLEISCSDGIRDQILPLCVVAIP